MKYSIKKKTNPDLPCMYFCGISPINQQYIFLSGREFTGRVRKYTEKYANEVRLLLECILKQDLEVIPFSEVGNNETEK